MMEPLLKKPRAKQGVSGHCQVLGESCRVVDLNYVASLWKIEPEIRKKDLIHQLDNHMSKFYLSWPKIPPSVSFRKRKSKPKVNPCKKIDQCSKKQITNMLKKINAKTKKSDTKTMLYRRGVGHFMPKRKSDTLFSRKDLINMLESMNVAFESSDTKTKLLHRVVGHLFQKTNPDIYKCTQKQLIKLFDQMGVKYRKSDTKIRLLHRLIRHKLKIKQSKISKLDLQRKILIHKVKNARNEAARRLANRSEETHL